MFQHEFAEAIVNTTNTTGVMGGGIALHMRFLFPDECDTYNKMCLRKELKGGDVVIQDISSYRNNSFKWLIQFATKQDVFADSKIEYITKGLENLVKVIVDNNIGSIVIPPLGCGLGGLQWSEVKPIILKAVEPLKNVVVYIYEQ